MKTRTPDNFLPSNDLAWVVYLSQRFEERHGVREGCVCRRLWPDVDPERPWPSLGTTPLEWVRSRLDHEARPCGAGGAGLLRKNGPDYLSREPHRDKPEWLRREEN